MATNGGAANGYYNQQYSMEQQGSYQQNQTGYQQGPQRGYGQPPPNYDQGDSQKYGAQGNLDSKQTFDSAFKIQKPKYNDIIFGILVCHANATWRLKINSLV